jgi:carbamoyltransferase
MDVAASLQAMYEKTLFHMLNNLHRRTGSSQLCLAGGCAMNSVANGKIFDNTPFKEIYVQAAAGDSGGAVGAAFYVYNSIKKHKREFVMKHAYLGPDYSNEEIKQIVEENMMSINEKKCIVEYVEDYAKTNSMIADLLVEGNIVGYFQGRMEWGPRALGHRSILCDPRRKDAKNLLNLKIKMRESFRPFAPSILREHVKEWFEIDYDVPFMLQVYPVKKEKTKVIPSVTHVNGTGRLQTVTKEDNGIFYDLIKAFYDRTKVPILLNTSFNENEPIVCTPQEALDCFLRTQMDILVLGKVIIKRRN